MSADEQPSSPKGIVRSRVAFFVARFQEEATEQAQWENRRQWRKSVGPEDNIAKKKKSWRRSFLLNQDDNPINRENDLRQFKFKSQTQLSSKINHVLTSNGSQRSGATSPIPVLASAQSPQTFASTSAVSFSSDPRVSFARGNNCSPIPEEFGGSFGAGYASGGESPRIGKPTPEQPRRSTKSRKKNKEKEKERERDEADSDFDILSGATSPLPRKVAVPVISKLRVEECKDTDTDSIDQEDVKSLTVMVNGIEESEIDSPGGNLKRVISQDAKQSADVGEGQQPLRRRNKTESIVMPKLELASRERSSSTKKKKVKVTNRSSGTDILDRGEGSKSMVCLTERSPPVFLRDAKGKRHQGSSSNLLSGESTGKDKGSQDDSATKGRAGTPSSTSSTAEDKLGSLLVKMKRKKSEKKKVNVSAKISFSSLDPPSSSGTTESQESRHTLLVEMKRSQVSHNSRDELVSGDEKKLLDYLVVQCKKDLSTSEDVLSFFVGYRMYFSPNDLLSRLIKCHARLENQFVSSKVQESINESVYYFVMHWVTEFGMVDLYPTNLISHVLKFSNRVFTEQQSNAIKLACLRLREITKLKAPRPAPQGAELLIKDADPAYFAEQLTYIESKIYKSIHSTEFVYHIVKPSYMSKEEIRARTMNITKSAEWFNTVSQWVATQVVVATNPKKQAASWVKFIKVARRLLALNNFNSLLQVMSGLSNAAISRLKATKKLLPQKEVEHFRELEEICSAKRGFAKYRSIVKETEGPAIPYLAVHLRDLQYIKDGNPDHIEVVIEDDFTDSEGSMTATDRSEDDSMKECFFKEQDMPKEIQLCVSSDGLNKLDSTKCRKELNFEKIRLMRKTVKEAQRFRQQNYYIVPDKSLQNKILGISPLDYDILYEYSCQMTEKQEWIVG